MKKQSDILAEFAEDLLIIIDLFIECPHVHGTVKVDIASWPIPCICSVVNVDVSDQLTTLWRALRDGASHLQSLRPCIQGRIWPSLVRISIGD